MHITIQITEFASFIGSLTLDDLKIRINRLKGVTGKSLFCQVLA